MWDFSVSSQRLGVPLRNREIGWICWKTCFALFSISLSTTETATACHVKAFIEVYDLLLITDSPEIWPSLSSKKADLNKIVMCYNRLPRKLLYLNNKINNRRHHKISEVMEWSVTVVYYYVYFTNIQVVIYWKFFFYSDGWFRDVKPEE